MKKFIIITALTFSSLYSASAITYTVDDNTDCIFNVGGPIDTVTCYATLVTATVNNVNYVNTTINVDMTQDLYWTSGVQCLNGGTWDSCGSTDLRTKVDQAGTNQLIDRGTSNTTLQFTYASPGTYNITLDSRPKGETGTRCTHGTSCSFPAVGTGWPFQISVSSTPATVDLHF